MEWLKIRVNDLQKGISTERDLTMQMHYSTVTYRPMTAETNKMIFKCISWGVGT